MKHLGSVTEIDGARIEPVDIIAGGTPCQGNSQAGKRKGLADNRSGLFFEMIRIIREMKEATNGEYPKYIIFENVPGLLSVNKGNDFETVLNEFQNLGFIIDANILDAQDFGLAQCRKRIFLVCTNARHIAKMKTITSFSIITQCLAEILLCFLIEMLQGLDIEPQNLKLCQKTISKDGLKKKTKLLGIEEPERLNQLLKNWDEMFQKYAQEQENSNVNLNNLGQLQELKTIIDINDFPNLMEQGLLYGSISRQWKKLLGDRSLMENMSIISTASKEIIAQKIYGYLILLENIAKRIVLLKNFCPNLSGAESLLLTARKEFINYAKQEQTNRNLFDELGWVQLWNNYLRECAETDSLFKQYFRGERASKILFKPESNNWHFEARGTEREKVTGRSGNSLAGTIVLNDQGGGIMNVSHDIVGTLRAQTHGHEPLVFDCRGNGNGQVVNTITGDHQNRVTDYTAIAVHQNQAGEIRTGAAANTLSTNSNASGRNAPLVCVATGQAGAEIIEDKSPTLNCNHEQPYIASGSIVRRLTPVECERLMGLPDGYTALGHDNKPISDTARYRAIGNSVALPCVEFIMRNIKESI